MDPGEKFPECLRNLGVLLLIFFFLFLESCPLTKLRGIVYSLHCSLGLLKTNLTPLETCSGIDRGFVVINWVFLAVC